MPIPGYGPLTSSDAFTGGQKYTRLIGPALIGQLADNASGPGYNPSALIMVQSTLSAVNQLITTTGQTANVSFVYIPQGTLAVTSSGTANIAASPPFTGVGAAMYWDGTRNKLSIFSTIAGDWKSVSFSSS